jgi:hypothetical protein
MSDFDKLTSLYENPFHKMLFEMVETVMKDKSFEGVGVINEEDLKYLDQFAESLSKLAPKEVISEMSARARRKEAEEFLVSLPAFIPTEAWGDPNSVDRKTMNRIFSVVGGGADVAGKLAYLQRLSHPSNRITSPRRIISTLIILEALAALIKNFNEASAGFVFEGWLSALLHGRQEAERTEKGNLPIQDLVAFTELRSGGGEVPVSLKLLSPKTLVEGSFTNLVDALFDEPDFGGRMLYVVARKLGESIAIEAFEINQENFIDMLTLTAREGVKQTGSELFQLPPSVLEKYPEAEGNSIGLIKSTKSAPERYKLLRMTAGYRIRGQKFTPPAEDSPDVSEGLLNESANTQWSLSVPQIESLSAKGYFKLQRLGELPSTRDAIIDVAAMHMDNIRDAFMALFAAFKDLNENINKYITYEKRNAAIKAGEKAIANTTVIEEEIRDKVADDKEDPNAPPAE